MKCFWIFGHDWDLWKPCRLIITPHMMNTPILSMQYTVAGQSRTCKKCGKEQTRSI